MAPKKEKKVAKTASDILWYYPNIIGYMRFAFMLASFAYAHTNWQLSIGFYFAAFAGDVLDGYVARAFNQCKWS
jgi:phosphatidylglycerophosphate synthase